MILKTKLEQLVKELALPDTFFQVVERYYAPLAKTIHSEVLCHKQNDTQQPMVLGIQGTQGSGKSTCAAFIDLILREQYEISSVIISIDDLYLTRSDRQDLADNVHPLFLTRGVPGTHDLPLAEKTFNALLNQACDQTVVVPRFDKSADDRLPETSWEQVKKPVDLVILEGWCVGLPPIDLATISEPINSLEKDEDQQAIWRQLVAEQLNEPYQNLFGKLDYLLVIQAPSFECVHSWRLLQEQKLQEHLEAKGGNLSASKVMSQQAISRFIQHYERLTRHALACMPKIADWTLWLDKDHKVTALTSGSQSEDTFLVATDLDGTLLDHHDYSWSAARPAIRALRSQKVPLVLNTSKTLDEVLEIQQSINICAPVIVENGSALFIPYSDSEGVKSELIDGDDFRYKLFGRNRKDILDYAHDLRDQKGYQFQGFSDWTIEQIAKMTDLTTAQAGLAANKCFSEPFIWQDNKIAFDEFVKLMRSAGFQIMQGGRFYHIQGQTDKSKPLQWLKQHYAAIFGKQTKTNLELICLGDNHNDVDMLNAADLAVCVKSPVSSFPELDNQNIIYTQAYGPVGWNQAMLSILTN